MFVLNVVDGCIPSDLATGTTAEIEEERRLLYVAMLAGAVRAPDVARGAARRLGEAGADSASDRCRARERAACGADRRWSSEPAPAPFLGRLASRIAGVALGLLVRLQGSLSLGFFGGNQGRELGGLALGLCPLFRLDGGLPEPFPLRAPSWRLPARPRGPPAQPRSLLARPAVSGTRDHPARAWYGTVSSMAFPGVSGGILTFVKLWVSVVAQRVLRLLQRRAGSHRNPQRILGLLRMP